MFLQLPTFVVRMIEPGGGTRKIGVLHIITGLAFGGAEQVVLDLVRYADRSSFEVHVACLSNEAGRLDQFRAVGVEPIVYGLEKSDPVATLKVVFALVRLIRREHIDLVHAHLFHGGLVAQLVRLFSPSVPLVFTPHNVTFNTPARDALMRRSARLRTTDIVFSESMIDQGFSSRQVVIPNGIAIEPVPEQPKNERFTFISIAGLRRVKNHVFLAECAARLIEKGLRDFEIWIVGEGETEADVRAAIARFGVEKHVKMKGFQRDVFGFAARAHCFVMPSLWEGFPISILEAGLAELPVVATPVGSIPDMLADGCGYVADLPDFAETMFQVATNYEAAKGRGRNLRQKVARDYDIRTVVREHEGLYRRVVG